MLTCHLRSVFLRHHLDELLVYMLLLLLDVVTVVPDLLFW